MKKIGILGGTFDPVHLGHQGLAQDALHLADLDEVIMIPAKVSPFKTDRDIASAQDRLAMLKIAAENMDGIGISTFEIDSEGVSYTYITLKAMQEIYGEDAELFFITGTDAFLSIERWKNSEELLTNYSFIVGTRPGYREDELAECIEHIYKKYGTNIVSIDNEKLDISSTEIRNRIAKGESAKDLVLPEIESYIKSKGLYNGRTKA